MSEPNWQELNPGSIDPALAISGVGVSELETFLVVADLGSFSLAAKRLHLSQPAVTARVQKLETLLGTKLLRRTTRSVELTETGARLATRARHALRELRDLIAEFAQKSNEARHRVVVAATPMLAATLLPGAIGRYSARYPDVDVIVLDQRHTEALQLVQRGECDLGVLAMDEPQPRLRFTPLRKEPIVLVVPQGHPLADCEQINLRQLESWPVMVLDQYSALLQKIKEQYQHQGMELRPTATAANLTTLLGMLDAGRGLVLLPRAMAQHNASRPRCVVKLADCEVYRDYGVFVLRTGQLSVAARSFVDFLVAECQDHHPR